MNYFDWEKTLTVWMSAQSYRNSMALVCCATSLQKQFHLLTEGGKPPSSIKLPVQVRCLIFITLQGLSLGLLPCSTEPEVSYTTA